MEDHISIKPPIIASMGLLLLAIFPLPYGFYTLVRIVVCLSAAFMTWISYKKNMSLWMWIMIVVLILFNPLFPIHFLKELWILLDIATCFIFGFFLFKYNRRVK